MTTTLEMLRDNLQLLVPAPDIDRLRDFDAIAEYVANEVEQRVRERTAELAAANRALAAEIADRKRMERLNRRLQAALREEAIRDPLTGLFNRRYLNEVLAREMHKAQRRGRTLALLMVDVDHFKQFNDRWGHAAGDTLLQAVGTLLQAHIRQEDIACRYGGEEFALLLPELTPGAAAARAESLRCAIHDLVVRHEDQSLGPVTISIGVASFPEHGSDGASLLQAADEALYAAKRAGRDRVVQASELLVEPAHRRME